MVIHCTPHRFPRPQFSNVLLKLSGAVTCDLRRSSADSCPRTGWRFTPKAMALWHASSCCPLCSLRTWPRDARLVLHQCELSERLEAGARISVALLSLAFACPADWCAECASASASATPLGSAVMVIGREPFLLLLSDAVWYSASLAVPRLAEYISRDAVILHFNSSADAHVVVEAFHHQDEDSNWPLPSGMAAFSVKASGTAEGLGLRVGARPSGTLCAGVHVDAPLDRWASFFSPGPVGPAHIQDLCSAFAIRPITAFSRVTARHVVALFASPDDIALLATAECECLEWNCPVGHDPHFIIGLARLELLGIESASRLDLEQAGIFLGGADLPASPSCPLGSLPSSSSGPPICATAGDPPSESDADSSPALIPSTIHDSASASPPRMRELPFGSPRPGMFGARPSLLPPWQHDPPDGSHPVSWQAAMVRLGGGSSVQVDWTPGEATWFHPHLACLGPAAEIAALRCIHGEHASNRPRLIRPAWAASPIGASQPLAANRWSEASASSGMTPPSSAEDRFFGPRPPSLVGPPVVPVCAHLERFSGVLWGTAGPCKGPNLLPGNPARMLRAARNFDIQCRSASFPRPPVDASDFSGVSHGARHLLDLAGFPRLIVPPHPGTWLEMTESWFLMRHDMFEAGHISQLLPSSRVGQLRTRSASCSGPDGSGRYLIDSGISAFDSSSPPAQRARNSAPDRRGFGQ